MLPSLCKIVTDCRTIYSKFNHVRYVQTVIEGPTDQQLFTVSYFTKSCGLSLENVVSASKLVEIVNRERSDSVIEVLTSHGFTKIDISKLVCREPRLILMNPEILKPKIEYFESLGIVGPLLVKILGSYRHICFSSLKNRIIPNIEFLRSYVETNENIVFALKQSSSVLTFDIQKAIMPNITTLQALSVPQDCIRSLIRLNSQSLMLRIDLFEKLVKELLEIGYDPTTHTFVLAIRSISMIYPEKFENKKALLLSFGWTGKDINTAFKVQPHIMQCSLEKMNALMDFFMHKMGLNPLALVKCPNLFLTSLKKRIIPRWSVLQALMSKGLIKKDIDVIWAMNRSKEYFEKKFVTPFEVIPETKAYRDEMKLHASKQ